MKERDFSLYDKAQNIQIDGGVLWKIEARGEDGQMWRLDTQTKTLSVFLQPNDELSDVKDGLFELIRQHDRWMHLYFSFLKRVPSLLILVPAILTVILIAFGSVLGDSAVAVSFTEGDEPTIFGISRFWQFMIMGGMATLMLYSFPAFFSGEQEGFVQYINNRFSQRSLIRERFRKAFDFLKKQGAVSTVVVWNPHFGEDKADWITQSLIPALVDSSVKLILQIKIDERNAAQNYIARLTKRSPDEIEWEEQYFDQEATKTIPYEYLENWEKRLLAIYTFASTANLPNKWKDLDGSLKNAVSLDLVEEIIERFKERLFAEEDLKQLISLDTFASRCVNDFGILEPCLRYSRHTHKVWEIAESVVKSELASAQEEMRFIYSFLEMNITVLADKINDPVVPLIINSLYSNKISIYNDNRLKAVRYFVQVVRDLEQYKIFKAYWASVIASPQEKQNTTSESDAYRVIGVNWLIDLAALFEKAAMYDRAKQALDFIEKIYPYRGKVGKARVAERQGDYLGSTKAMLDIREQHLRQELVLGHASRIDLNLNIAWAIVSGRLEAYREQGLQALAEAEQLLHADFDEIRSSESIIRLYNITANYEEWAGNPAGSIDNYDKALQIPGAEQAGLSNLLVNKGIALRQEGRLAEGAHFGEQGVEIKTAIGDADQLPIALHNLAQTYILLAYSLPESERATYFERALQHATTGLDIQAQTGSVKKRGQLLAERFIATYELDRARHIALNTAQQYLSAVQEWLIAEQAEGRDKTYDYKVVWFELLEIIPSLKGDSDWLRRSLV